MNSNPMNIDGPRTRRSDRVNFGTWFAVTFIGHAIGMAIFIGLAGMVLNIPAHRLWGPYSLLLECGLVFSVVLYWARLADENGYPPVMLNLLAPELTHRMVENIFATYLGDWPSLLRALRETGEEFQQGKIASLPHPGGAAPL